MVAANQVSEQDLQSLYMAYSGRPGDPAGLEYWRKSGTPAKAITTAFQASAEFQTISAGLNIEQQIEILYQNLFDRRSDSTGLKYWSNLIARGATTIATLAIDFIHNVSQPSGHLPDQEILYARRAVAQV